MTPRLVTRTHYQVDEPAYLRILVLRCTSASKSEYRERVAARLVKELKALGDFNPTAAEYAIDLARACGLLNDNLVWTDFAHLLNLVHSKANAESDELTVGERLLFFRLLLHSDGAALIYFLRRLAEKHLLPENGGDWNAIANELFLWTFNSYYEFTSDLQSRTRLRQLIQRREKKPFRGHSGEHQCFFHLQSLYRLGLVGRRAGERGRIYSKEGAVGTDASVYLLKQLDGIKALEDAVDAERWCEFGAYLYFGRSRSIQQDEAFDAQFYAGVFASYSTIQATGAPLCSLRTLVDKARIDEILRGQTPRPYGAYIETLKRLQRSHPRKVHFHVDRFGHPAYIAIDPVLLKGELTAFKH